MSTVHHAQPDTADLATFVHVELRLSSPAVVSAAAARVLAVLRVSTGFIFVVFLDKRFGLGYSTTSAQAWIHGGSPTKGFLSRWMSCVR